MTDTVLELNDVYSGYGRTQVLRGIDLRVGAGELVTLIGSNGAGKSTLLKTVVGLLNPTQGLVSFPGLSERIRGPEALVRSGVSLVPEGRLLFGPMTVRENLEIGAFTRRRDRAKPLSGSLQRVFSLFPTLLDRAGQRAETLSGGEQQMLAIGRALMSHPTLLLLDEPSLGLAPKVIAEIFSALDALRGDGVTMLLVEQDARLALKHADRGYVLKTGRVVLEGRSKELLSDESVQKVYLGSWKGEGHA